MSKRFGRNQKRKLREAVAAAETENNMLSSALKDRGYAIRKLTKDLEAIVRAIEAVCPYSICVPMKEVQVKDFPDYYKVGTHLPLHFDIARMDMPAETCVMSEVKLRQLTCYAEFDWARLATCCHVRLNGHGCSMYYASEDAVATQEHTVIEETARRMAICLSEQVRKRRRTYGKLG